MITKLIFSFRQVLVFLAPWLAGGLLWGASNKYVAIFSAEQESHRRIILDGVGNRRVEVELNDLGQAEVKVWGVGEKAYVGRRVYDSGHLIPVIVQVEFPRKNLMSIQVTGTRFRDYVRYKVVDSDLYVIDLYTRALPSESYFREETISALWPGERFLPDIAPGATLSEPDQAGISQLPNVSRTLGREMVPYRRIVLRAVVWAGCVSGLLSIAGLALVWFRRRQKSIITKSASYPQAHTAGTSQPTISDAQVRAFMALDGSLSYDEATLLTTMGEEKSSRKRRGSVLKPG
ncbi:MAG: hypothetical protein JSU77_04215 [Fidelibacterota bacterium]|nr:MAG: hypothetical protein JSU77_04215 [Candidatus Neomarinimicrobiota bacterium]